MPYRQRPIVGTMPSVNFIRLHDVEPLIKAKWAGKQPFSLVRIGDGELSVLGHPATDPERMQHVLRRAMTDREYADHEIRSIRDGMVEAVQSADIVGMYDSYEPNELCTVYEDTLTNAGLGWMTACHPNVHIFMQSVGTLDRLIRMAQRITLISGRDVLDQFKNTYPHATVNQHLIPVERQYELSTDAGADEHYPDVYGRIKNALRPDGPCHLYLIGAGLLAKEYCSIVKSRGGFALDIGSIFDYWADVPTREGRRAIVGGKAALAGESRWPSIFLGSAPDPDGIARTAHRGMLRPQEITARPSKDHSS